MTYTEALSLLREAIQKGIKIGEDITQTREAQRLIIAYRVKTERQAKGFTVKDICEKINANELTYRNYESCKSDIPIMYLVRIADTLELSLDYLTGRTDDRDDRTDDTIEQRLKRIEEYLNLTK